MSKALDGNPTTEESSVPEQQSEKVVPLAPANVQTGDSDDGAPLRILLPSYRSNPTTGGQGVYMRHISKALVELGHHVDVISGPPYPDLDPRVGLIELPSLDLYATPHPIRAFRPWMLTSPLDLFEWWSHNWGGFPEPYTFGERMAKYMEDKIDQYDVMHDNQTLCWGMLKVRDMGLPVAGTIHHPITMDRRIDVAAMPNPWMKFLKWRWYTFLNMQIKVARQLRPVIVVSDSTKRDVVREFGVKEENMKTVYHGINHEVFEPRPHITRVDNQLVVCASADVPLKGLIFLLRAYAKLLPDHPDLKLVVIGKLREGPTAKELRKLGIMDKVIWKTGLSDSHLVDEYAEATIAISPSVYEGFGFPAGEAMCCGAPVITTNGGSLPEVAGDAAIVVQHSDPDALAAAIADLLNNPKKRAEVGRAGRERILTKFKWEHAARNVVAIYREAIANANNQSKRART